jgi:maltodextrin utilization protein YvdJ
MKELYTFLSDLIASYDEKIFIDLHKRNYEEDVITQPCVLIDMTNIAFKTYKKDVLMAEVQGKLHYIQDEYTDSYKNAPTQEKSLKILENVQNLISRIYLATNEYFSQIQVQFVEQVSEVTNLNTFVINFSTTFLLQRDKTEKILKIINLNEILTY